MSWSFGLELFDNCSWAVREGIPDDTDRHEFLVDLMRLFLESTPRYSPTRKTRP